MSTVTKAGPRAYTPDGLSYGSFASVAEPDGNAWLLQEVTEPAPGR